MPTPTATTRARLSTGVYSGIGLRRAPRAAVDESEAARRHSLLRARHARVSSERDPALDVIGAFNERLLGLTSLLRNSANAVRVTVCDLAAERQLIAMEARLAINITATHRLGSRGATATGTGLAGAGTICVRRASSGVALERRDADTSACCTANPTARSAGTVGRASAAGAPQRTNDPSVIRKGWNRGDGDGDYTDNAPGHGAGCSKSVVEGRHLTPPCVRCRLANVWLSCRSGGDADKASLARVAVSVIGALGNGCPGCARWSGYATAANVSTSAPARGIVCAIAVDIRSLRVADECDLIAYQAQGGGVAHGAGEHPPHHRAAPVCEPELPR